MIKIVDVNITTNRKWQEVSNHSDWNTVKNTNTDWLQLKQTTVVGNPVFIEVEIIENDWLTISQLFNSWKELSSKFTNWLDLKNW